MTSYQAQHIALPSPIQEMPDFSSALLPSTLEVSRILDDVRNALDSDPAAARECIERLARFLKIGTGAREHFPSRGGLAPWQRRKIESHIEARLDTQIRIKTLAELVSLSVGHFSRAFKETFGVSPHAHILRQRIARAKKLMLADDEALSQIALVCGFADQAHFSNVFHRVVGKAPNAWRRANIELR